MKIALIASLATYAAALELEAGLHAEIESLVKAEQFADSSTEPCAFP